jgi:hypothetical protein
LLFLAPEGVDGLAIISDFGRSLADLHQNSLLTVYSVLASIGTH